ncbi:hypothetical protein SAMN05216249_12629 [Acetitomaculum ruminis DSM 5522]|uniref:Uncharacterized protein n=1 Tax=Acetitomaculum ruminis DSM 5522 TaxID=1120918 RepID=A0A1I1AFK4_9FIRM|nr:hypothetical protein SAMN05216249_12629 [Acetitomaculum ruminis DSM 5522]
MNINYVTITAAVIFAFVMPIGVVIWWKKKTGAKIWTCLFLHPLPLQSIGYNFLVCSYLVLLHFTNFKNQICRRSYRKQIVFHCLTNGIRISLKKGRCADTGNGMLGIIHIFFHKKKGMLRKRKIQHTVFTYLKACN